MKIISILFIGMIVIDIMGSTNLPYTPPTVILLSIRKENAPFKLLVLSH